MIASIYIQIQKQFFFNHVFLFDFSVASEYKTVFQLIQRIYVFIWTLMVYIIHI